MCKHLADFRKLVKKGDLLLFAWPKDCKVQVSHSLGQGGFMLPMARKVNCAQNITCIVQTNIEMIAGDKQSFCSTSVTRKPLSLVFSAQTQITDSVLA